MEQLEAKKGWAVRITGTTEHQTALAELSGGRTKEGVLKFCKAVLVHDETSAVAVYINNHRVGYLPDYYAPQFRAHYPSTCTDIEAVIIDDGFEDRPKLTYLRVLLNLPKEL